MPSALKAVQSSESLVRDRIPPSLSLSTKHDNGAFVIPVSSYDAGGQV